MVSEDVVSEKEAANMLMNVSILIDKICDTLLNFQRCYSINAVTFLTYFTFSSIFCLFGVISHFMSTSADRDDFFIMLIVWTLYNFPFVLWTFLFASRIKNTSENVHANAFKILETMPTSKVLRSVQTLTMQMSHRQPQFSCGLFVYDWFFMFVIIGTIFSYLLILLQFELQGWITGRWIIKIEDFLRFQIVLNYMINSTFSHSNYLLKPKTPFRNWVFASGIFYV